MQQDFVQQDCLHHGHRYQVFIVRLMLGIALEISTWIGVNVNLELIGCRIGLFIGHALFSP
uniref:Uncharacterized protein n=1 Tax=Hyaloperonospora arabidopsidis (strain Emoy2) TaxID=559515 RepID=M4BMS1_HYAAE